MIIFGGTYASALANTIAILVGGSLGRTSCKIFKDGEISLSLDGSLKDSDVVLIQSLQPGVSERLIELIMMMHSAVRGGARTLRVVIPYMAYTRGDGKMLEVIASFFKLFHLKSLITFDMHSNFFKDIAAFPVISLSAFPLFENRIRLLYKDPVLVAPDKGISAAVKALAHRLRIDFAHIHKIRGPLGQVQASTFSGSVQGRTCVIMDDMVDSGATMIMAAKLLASQGASDIHAYATHGILSRKAIRDIQQSCLSTLTLTDTVYPLKAAGPFWHQVSVAPLITKVLKALP